MSDAGFPVEVVQDVPVVAAPEQIDVTNAPALRTALLAAAALGAGTLVVDMSKTTFCDTAGLHALVTAYRRARAEDRQFLLVIPGTIVLRIFSITGLDRVIPYFPSLDEALASGL